MDGKGASRRRFVASVGMLTGGLCTRGFGQVGGCETVVATPTGRVRGECLAGCRVFRGVPFAEAPVGALRFRPPVRMKAWAGVRDATRFAAAPLQTGANGVAQSEDCLHLNVWAPEGKGPFPVYVWIHGGGFTGGHSFEPTYDGSGFALEGVVCVTVGYRLGVFGFLDLEPALGTSYAGSANNGLRDLIAALEWVKGNIAAFGGDPGRVTVGGESAGAKLADILLGVPAAKGLFQQGISESGGAERVWPHATAKGIGAGFAEDWKKTGAGEGLLRVAGEKLLPVQKGVHGSVAAALSAEAGDRRGAADGDAGAGDCGWTGAGEAGVDWDECGRECGVCGAASGP